MKRIYLVIAGDQEHLVRATSAAAAIRVIAQPMFMAHVANQENLVRLAKTHPIKEG